MKNKIHLKKYLIVTFIISIFLLSIFLLINIYEYNTYTDNFNNKIDLIVAKVKEKYPDIDNTEIMEILNNDELKSSSILEQYGINLIKDSVVIENNRYFHDFLILNGIILIIGFILIVSSFLLYDRRKDKE